MKKINLLIICLLVFQLANSQTNLITNGDLENWSSTSLDNWQSQEGSISQELVELTSGASSALFVDGDTTPRLLALNFPVEAGKTYTLSYDFKVKTGSSNFGQQVIGTKYGGADFSPYTSSSRIPQNFDWNTREVEIEVTETEDWQFEISLGNFIDEAFEVYIDNISFTEVIPEPDRDALIAIYNALDGPNWTNTWDLDAPYTQWYGVSYDQTTYKVTRLALFNNNLSGEIPEEIGQLDAISELYLGRNSNITGAFPQAIFELQNLIALSLDNTANFNEQLPLGLFEMPNLAFISLKGCGFTGELPETITNGAQIARLDLSFNNLTGSLPQDYGNYTSLQYLDLERNNLEGVVPDLSSLTALTQLKLRSNNFTGVFPQYIFQFEQLFSLDMSGNDFEAFSLPDDAFSNLQIIRSLWLGEVSLQGSLPSSIEDLPNLEIAVFSGNNLSGVIPQIASPNFNFLALGENNYVFDDLIPGVDYYNETTTLTYSNQKKLNQEEEISIMNDPITLSVTGVPNMNNTFQWLKNGSPIEDATSPSFTIENPSSLDAGIYTCEVSNSIITDLILTRNNITLTGGTLPEPDREALIALYNATDGENWSTTWDLTQGYDTWFGITTDDQNKVTRINLPNNNLVGTIPSELADLDALRDLVISNNEISGVIPQSLTALELLSTLDVAINKLSGDIPLLNLSRLSFFALNDNEYIFENLEPAIDYYPSGGPLIFNYIGQANIDDEQTLAITEGEAVTLSVTETSSATNTYEWFKNGNPIDGATEADFTIDSLVLADSGAYTCEVKNIEVPNLTLTRNTITLDITLGVNNNNFSNSVSIISNAKEKQLSIETNANLQSEVSLTVYNLLGQIVVSTSFIEATTLPTSTWSSGIYVVKLQSENTIVTRKVLIK
ncbi:immunoglobulin domain-containing protein [uncultured Dokdonia sp.]|uniref:immunoglobulin domain-containing protein n=1 Tax=Dokdonia sp. R78006 TaxID=3093866 RepID=UPI00262F5D09|nr:immunoglobulin domain-containing protein [uncultured Dokdonia sp.]